MLTLGLAIWISAVAQPAEAPQGREEVYASLVGQQIRVSLPSEITQEPGFAEALRDRYQGFIDAGGNIVERFGQLVSAKPVRQSGEFLLEIKWDEPLSPGDGTIVLLNDTLRLGSKTFKLDVASEDPDERSGRYKAALEAADYVLIGKDPLDRASWVAASQVKRAEASLQLVRENEQREADLNAAQASAPPAPEAPAEEPKGVLSGRGPEIVVVLAGLALAGVVLKILVF